MGTLNYGTLQTEVLTIAKRAAMTAEVVGAIRRCEGMIKRKLVGYELQATLAESDRSSAGIYTEPTGCMFVQHIFTDDAQSRTYEIERVGHANIKQLVSTAQVLNYAHYETFVEFRGSPATDQNMVVHYIGHPTAFASDSDNNVLLDEHEDIYISGSLFQLYSGYTEDLELAQGQLDIFTDAVETLNDSIRRKLGGGIVAGGYNLGNLHSSRGY
jgi:hypothetical protein